MTADELIDTIVDVASDINNLTSSQLSMRIPNRDLRDALMLIYANAFQAGVAQGVRDSHAKVHQAELDYYRKLNGIKEELEDRRSKLYDLTTDISRLFDYMIDDD